MILQYLLEWMIHLRNHRYIYLKMTMKTIMYQLLNNELVICVSYLWWLLLAKWKIKSKMTVWLHHLCVVVAAVVLCVSPCLTPPSHSSLVIVKAAPLCRSIYDSCPASSCQLWPRDRVLNFMNIMNTEQEQWHTQLELAQLI